MDKRKFYNTNKRLNCSINNYCMLFLFSYCFLRRQNQRIYDTNRQGVNLERIKNEMVPILLISYRIR